MRDVQLSEAMAMVKRELNKIGMCKRGTIEADIHTMRAQVPKAIKLKNKTKAEINKLLKKERKRLHSMLKFIPPSALKATDYHDLELIQPKSLDKYWEAMDTLMAPHNLKEYQESVSKRDFRLRMLGEQKDARIAYLDAELSTIDLEFMTGVRRFETLPAVIDGLESYSW